MLSSRDPALARFRFSPDSPALLADGKAVPAEGYLANGNLAVTLHLAGGDVLTIGSSRPRAFSSPMDWATASPSRSAWAAR